MSNVGTINVIDFCLTTSIFCFRRSIALKMRFILLATLALAALALAEEDGTYTDRFDDLNIEEILANRRLLVPYLKCALDKGRCTPEGKELKLHIKDAMQTGCKKCTDKQKSKGRKVVNHIRENEKVYWEQLLAKYDPKDEYKEIYEAFLAAKD